MDFSASQKCINELLSRNCSYSIPKNQRKYVWDEVEWDELFEDIFLIEQNNDYAHFIGSFVFSKTKNQNEYLIIDGQQRLITISILLLCMSDKLNEAKEIKASQSIIYTFLLGRDSNGDEFYKITRDDGIFFLTTLIDEIKQGKSLASEEAQKLFKSNFDEKDKYNKKVLSCFIYFKKRIDEFVVFKKKNKKETIAIMRDKLIACQNIEIIVGTDFEGFRVFETLNARGIPLEQHELIKNFFYSYLRSKTKIANLDSKWQKIISNVVTEKADYFPAFITHYCVHKYGKIKKNEEFRTIRDKTEKKHVEVLLGSIWKCSFYYSYIINPEKYKVQSGSDYKVYVSLNFFHSLSIRQVRPLLLSLFEAYEDKKTITQKDFIESMNVLETFYFMYVTLLKGTTNQIDNSIILLAKKIANSDELLVATDLIKSELGKYISERDKIKEEFKTIGFSNKNKKFNNSSNKKCANYVLEKIEKSLDVNDEVQYFKVMSIEHIYNDSDTEDFAAYIGNLLPLSKRMNSKNANNEFAIKLERYKKSNLLMVKNFISHHGNKYTWNKNDILDRCNRLAEYCFNKIWFF